jgi:uncharacterized protein YbjT (DUF2867 family)
VGRLVDHLRDSGAEIRDLTNNPAKAALPAGVEVVAGRLGKLDTMSTALAGIDRMYLAPLPPHDAGGRRYGESGRRQADCGANVE